MVKPHRIVRKNYVRSPGVMKKPPERMKYSQNVKGPQSFQGIPLVGVFLHSSHLPTEKKIRQDNKHIL